MFLFTLNLQLIYIYFAHCMNGGTFKDLKGNSKEIELQINYQNNYVLDEYIVMLKNYYWSVTRAKYIEAAFGKTNITEWNIKQRTNPSQIYPSDFDIVQAKLTETDVQLLVLHPVIKTITQQHLVQRSLNYVTTSTSITNVTNRVEDKHCNRHILRAIPDEEKLIHALNVNELWKRGITGKGIKVAIFDTGLPIRHPHFRNVKERTNWTNEKLFSDGVSHGTFVAGIIASSRECFGVAPDVELHIYKVFTNNQVSYTSWFLDAFNYAIFRKVNILNLSIGGPDFMDSPFVDKVLEMSANKVIMISAIGNDGPYYGTLNNPGDQSDVIGVGGINSENNVATFSSRGMTTWELPYGYGRIKPDIVADGSQVRSSNVFGGCRALSGTSVASPVVAGATALILSGALNKSNVINPASVKQILIEGATRLPNNNIFEQGYGKLNVIESMELLLAYEPKITLSPPYVDYTQSYMWPFNSQPLFCQSVSSIVNVTILNGISLTSYIIEEPIWHPYKDENGEVIDVAIKFSQILWPWIGWMSIHIVVKNSACEFEGISKGHISLQIKNPLPDGSHSNHTVYLPLTIKIIAKPPRHKRILWDQFHNIRYPPGYMPRDNLKIKSDPLDWRADHLHTNFRDMYQHLRNLGYYVDVLREPFTCFNASNYGALLIVDPEEEYFNEEILKLENDVYYLGLGIMIFADWYNTTVMRKITFFDENTRQWWLPDTGGANIPALNDLLTPFNIALSDFVGEGYFRLAEHNMYYASGTTLKLFPIHDDNIVIDTLLNDQNDNLTQNDKKSTTAVPRKKVAKTLQPIIGMFQMHAQDKKTNRTLSQIMKITEFENAATPANAITDSLIKSSAQNSMLNKRILLKIDESNRFSKNNKMLENDKKSTSKSVKSNKKKNEMGRIAIIGDSNCIDSVYAEKSCFWLLNAFLEYVINSHKATLLKKQNRIKQYAQQQQQQQQQRESIIHELPKRLSSSNLYKFSKVLDVNDPFKKRSIDKCQVMEYATTRPIYFYEALNIWTTLHKKKEKYSLKDVYVEYRGAEYYISDSLLFVSDFYAITFSVFVVLSIVFMIYLKNMKKTTFLK